MLHRLLNIPLNPYFQAFVVAILIILFVHTGLKKYTARQVAMSTHFDKIHVQFADLNHNGQSEKILTFLNDSGNAGIGLIDGLTTLGQWNFRGIFKEKCPRIMIGDYDQDTIDELYIFTLVNDSVMLHALNCSRNPELVIHDRLITVIGKNLMAPDYLFFPGAVTDMTGDGSGDLVFAITAGHSKQPRNVFIYDIVNDSLSISPKSGAFIGKMTMENLDEDRFPEILLSTYASSNFNDIPFAYSDTSSWLMLLDHDLSFLFPPVEFPGPAGGLHLQTIETSQGEKRLFYEAVYTPLGIQKKKWCIADSHGKLINEKIIESEDPGYLIAPMRRPISFPSDKILAILENDGFYQINTSLEFKKISKAKFSGWSPDFIDIDQDGTEEFILLNPDHKKHVIYRNNFSHPVELDFPIQSTNPLFSIKLNGDNPPQLSVQGDQVWKLFEYGINPVYRFRFLIWIGIYLAVLSFILIIRELYSFQLKKKYETEKKITRLQLSSIKAQMEPHFIMNTINTIGSSIYRQKPDEAYNLLLNFSGMVRSLLLSSDKLTRSLKEEIDFVKNYLELEKTRFTEVFSFEVSIGESVNLDSIIPKMIIQLHAENALKHGFLPKKSGGLLDISVVKEGDYLLITITDNGIGRNLASKNISQSTGKGMKILAQFLETYNKHNKLSLRQEITDLTDEAGNPAGTQVKIYVPVDFNAGIF
jgi:two-component sensor histidine kinase